MNHPDHYNCCASEKCKQKNCAHASTHTPTPYTCPMHQEVERSKPGACPKCSMALKLKIATLNAAPNPELLQMLQRCWGSAMIGITLAFLVSATTIHATKEPSSAPEMVMDHALHKEPSKPTIKAEVLGVNSPKKGESNPIKIKLTSAEEGAAIRFSDLKEVHTKKIHILIFDQTLTDYQHVHPIPTKEPGVYQFNWTPQNEGTYKLWVDVVPLKTGHEEYIETNLTTDEKDNKPLDKTLIHHEKVGDNWYSLSFERKVLKKEQAAMGDIKIVDAQGHDFKELEPIMGAYAHIVAINEDFQTIAHVHPMGEEPTKDSDKGGPTLSFHFEPKKAGYYKIWLQVQIKGKDVYVPFGIEVK